MRSPVAKASRLFRRQRSTLITLLLTCALVLALGGAQAQAAPKGSVDFIGEGGSGAGQFSTPRGVAVEESTGHLYVVDSGNHRVQEFNELGMFERTWGWGVKTGTAQFETCTAMCRSGIFGAGAGQMDDPQGIAVDQATGDVYVTDRDNRRVAKFDPSGASPPDVDFLFAYGRDVSPAPGTGFEKCTTASGCKAGTSGGNPGQFAGSAFFPFTGHVAVDPRNQDVVVADPGNRRVQKFNSAGDFLFAFGQDVSPAPGTGFEKCTTASGCKAGTSGANPGQFSTSQPVRVAVDAAGSIYTVEATAGTGSGNRRVQKFNGPATSGGLFAPDLTSGTDGATTPTDVAVDSGTGHVLVAKSRQILELNVVGDLVETHAAAGGELPTANGMAVDSPGGWIYVSTTPDHRVFKLGQVTPPAATIAPTTDVEATTAEFHGTVNPNNGKFPTGYRFEYSDDGGASWTSVPIPDKDVGSGTTDQQVSEVATGLEPNTDYRVRLVASRPFAGGSATSDEDTFRTDAAPPSISDVGSREITDTSAVLVGRVDPNHSQTTYRFEYGTDTSYGNATPLDSAGSGARSVRVSKSITGLRPNTEYHFRLVASNAAGESQGADHTFTTEADPPRPSGRVYEMVSPVDKNGGNIERDVATGTDLAVQTGAASSGDAVAFVSRVNFGDPEAGSGGLGFPNYLARRGAGGWATEGILPPVSGDYPGSEPEVPRVPGLALDASRSFAVSGARLTPDAERLNGSHGLYMRGASQPADQRYTLISAPAMTLERDTSTFAPERFDWEGSTPDARHVVFSSSRQLLPDEPGEPDVPADTDSGTNAVYEWVDGTVRLASVLPPGLEHTSNPQVIAGGNTTFDMGSGALHGDNVISDDGGRVFFTATVTPQRRVLFVREDGATTRVVSASELPCNPPQPCDPPQTAADGNFWAAKGTDGSVAFFTSPSPLTADSPPSGGGLYRWDANAPEGQRLSLIWSGVPAGPTAVSDDATTVYFVSQLNLYMWRQGEGVRYVATLDDTNGTSPSNPDSPMWRTEWKRIGGRAARVSPDGERLLFASYAQLDPAYDTVEDSPEDCGDPEEAGDHCRQIYLYDAPSNRVSCLTCVAGAPLSGDANLFGNGDDRRPFGDNSQRTVDGPLDLPRNLSADGRRAFFETARPLVTGDENDAIDVYEWEDGDLDGEGVLRLVSSGRGASDSKFLDASASGRDVFFTARDRLVGIDNDNQVDLYNARVGGGFAAQNPSPAPPPCTGDDCQGARSGAPFLPGVGSGGTSHGDLRPGVRPSFSVARLSRKQQAKLARGRRVLVRVRVNRAGKIRLAARAKLGGRMRTVASSSKTARKAGSVRLSLKLSRSARRELARKSKLKVTLAVRFTGVREARTSTVNLSRARGAGERRPR
jgi:NHL repeat-containing protein